jgi:hypothetical protein
MEIYKKLNKLLLFWGGLIAAVDMLLSIDKNLDYKYYLIYGIAMSLLILIYFRLRLFDITWKALEIDLTISTIIFSILYITTVVNELKILGADLYWVPIVLIPFLMMIMLGVYTNYYVKRKKKDDNLQEKRSTAPAVGTAIITPMVASFYIIYRRFIRNRDEQLFCVFWIVMSIIATGIIIWICTVVLLEVHEKMHLENKRENDKVCKMK